MEDRQPDFSALMDELRGGSQEAAQRILEEYGPHVIRVIRRKLAKQMRTKFDSQDFAQAVWASFFSNIPEVSRMQDPKQLVAFLASMASNKVTDEVRRRLLSKKANVNREVSLAGMTESQFHPRTATATPSEFAMANEQLDTLLDSQPAHYRRIVEMRRDGATYVEIAESLHLHEGSVRRIIDRLSERLIQ